MKRYYKIFCACLVFVFISVILQVKVKAADTIIKNAKSNCMGKKDIIKIENEIETDLEMLGFIDPNITVNIIDGGKIIEKVNF